MVGLLLIGDNDLDRKIMRDLLAHHGYQVEEARDGAAGLRRLYDVRPDLIILDVMMPVMDGWTTCARIREACDTPVIMLTSLNCEEEMACGLDLGADDFVSKPISAPHLLARVRAVLRRGGGQHPQQDLLYDDGKLRIDTAKHEVTLDGVPVDLTPTEFRLLVSLVEAPNRVRSYADLLQSVSGP
jgi:DNA-binding response OmpR family regulator